MSCSLVSAELGAYRAPVENALAQMRKDGVIARILKKDHTLWKPSPVEIANRLGWLDSPRAMADHMAGLQAFAGDLRREGYAHALLLGMGGSSLAPEVFRKTFGVVSGCLDLAVLDSTDPGAVLAATETLDLTKTLFIVSTKSGGTIETLSLFKYCYQLCLEKTGTAEAGRHFIAVTDPGSGLAAMAEKYHFRKVFLNDPAIGGRYSALTYFGLAPAALIGMDAGRLLAEARKAAATETAHAEAPGKDALSGLFLGAVLGELAKSGRDKATFIFSPQIESFGAWLEQLIAESLGKEGRGILPVVGEPAGEAPVYGHDRVFVFMSLKGDRQDDHRFSALVRQGHPALHVVLDDPYDLGGQCFTWEMATAVAGHLICVNPFDQPDVEAAKVLARQMIADAAKNGVLPAETPVASEKGITVYGAVRAGTPGEAFAVFLNHVPPGGYIALQAFIQPTAEADAALQAMRLRLRDQFRTAVTTGYGPRYLHSTGQLHKGDGGKGLFIQFTADDARDMIIPDEADKPGGGLTFGALKAAQALGDGKALVRAGRRVMRFHLGTDAVRGLRLLTESL
ncbi:MAG: glucose-6-phosphate isomerase [Deltaproteobacteria bacterium]|nr:glucose-6-phosphate isomerase [Deltaproteobacteria bacterium]